MPLNDTETFINGVTFKFPNGIQMYVEYVWGDFLPTRGSIIAIANYQYEIVRDYCHYSDGRLVAITFDLENLV